MDSIVDMYIEDSFIRRYYSLSVIFLIASGIEGMLFLFEKVTAVNLVYLFFEILWLLVSFLMAMYIVIRKLPAGLLAFPLLYLSYFIVTFLHSFVLRENLKALDRDAFIFQNVIIILVFVALGTLACIWVRKKYFHKIMPWVE